MAEDRTLGMDCIDLVALDAWMAGNVAGHVGPVSLQKFSGGQSNPTFRLSTAAATYVMRSKPGPAARLLPSAHAIEREYRIIGALEKTAVPVPRLHGFCADESVIGRAFYLMEHVVGRTFWNQSLPGLSGAERGAIYDAMNAAISALHQVDVHAAGLQDYGRSGGYVARQVERWSHQYRASETCSIEAMDRLIEWLPQHLPSSDETRVVHGDFRIDNMIFHPTEPRLLAVLDWELSTLGHPVADFAYHCMAWNLPQDPFLGLEDQDLAGLGIPSEPVYLRRYCERTGRDMAPVQREWRFWIAFNFFKSASIAQGIARRALDGVASHADAAAYGQRAHPFAERAWRLAQAYDRQSSAMQA